MSLDVVHLEDNQTVNFNKSKLDFVQKTKTKPEDRPDILVLFTIVVIIAIVFFCLNIVEEEEQETN